MDATNMVTPEISIITNISLEHRVYLGNTIGAIAGEKAGIIKRDTPLVTGVTQKSALRAILDQASSLNAPIYLKGRDFNSRRSGTQQFSYYGIKDTWKRLELGLSGRHQIENATLALAACEILKNSSALELSKDDIFQGLIRTKWPGRLEVVATHPHLILDGAHNIMAARKLAQYLKENFKGRNITLIIGLLDDKPIDVILKDLIAPCNRIVVTQPVIDRAVPAKDLAEAAKKFTGSVDVVPDVGEALKRTWNNSVEEDVICVAGSLYVVGEAKTAWRKMEPAVA